MHRQEVRFQDRLSRLRIVVGRGRFSRSMDFEFIHALARRLERRPVREILAPVRPGDPFLGYAVAGKDLVLQLRGGHGVHRRAGREWMAFRDNIGIALRYPDRTVFGKVEQRFACLPHVDYWGSIFVDN